MTKENAYNIVIKDLKEQSVCQLSAHTVGCFSCAITRLAVDLHDVKELRFGGKTVTASKKKK